MDVDRADFVSLRIVEFEKFVLEPRAIEGQWTPNGSSSDSTADPRMETLVTSVPLSVCRNSPGTPCSRSSKFEARPCSIESVLWIVNPPGTDFFCSAACSIEGELREGGSGAAITTTSGRTVGALVEAAVSDRIVPAASQWTARRKMNPRLINPVLGAASPRPKWFPRNSMAFVFLSLRTRLRLRVR